MIHLSALDKSEVARVAHLTLRADQMQFSLPPAVALTVNRTNPAAYRCYPAGGFADTGRLYRGGRAGAQHILRMALSDHGRAAR